MTEAYGSSTAHTLVNTSLLSSPRATLASCSTLASLGQHRSITGTAKHTPGNGSAPRCSHTRLRPRHTRQATYPSFGSCSVAERLASWGAAFSRSRKACAEHWLRTQVQGRFLRAHYTGLVRCCLPARQSRRSHPSTVVGSAARAPFLPFLTATRRCYVTPCSVTHRHGARWTMTRPLWRGRARCAAWRSTRWMGSASYCPSHLCVLGAVLAAAGGTGAAALVPGVLRMQYVLPKRRESCHTSAVAAA